MKRAVVSSVALIGAASTLLILVFLSSGVALSPRGTEPASPTDVGSPGPYQVGAARRSISRPTTESGKPQEIGVLIWYPATLSAPVPAADKPLGAPLDAEPDRRAAPYPVVLFSHGSGGFGSTAFTTHVASHGFVVVALLHTGMRTDRPDELITVLDQLSDRVPADDELLTGLVDGARAGVTGYSLGGDSALRAGAKDHRFRAVIAMAPGGSGTGPPPLNDAASGVAAPAMLIWGMLDDVVGYVRHESLLNRLGQATTPRWLVTLPHAGHAAFTDRCPTAVRGCGPNDLPQDQAHALINRWATALLLRYVAGDERQDVLLLHEPSGDTAEIQVAYVPAGQTMAPKP